MFEVIFTEAMGLWKSSGAGFAFCCGFFLTEKN